MILCVYLNPTIDKTVYLDRLEIGATNRPDKVVTDGAGKAINVAVVLGMLGQAAKVMGLLYRSDGQIIKDRLMENGIDYDFIELAGVSRTNTKIFDGKTQTITEINENGQHVAEDVINRAVERICNAVNPGDTAVLTGSLPPGCPQDIYARLIAMLNQKGVQCILDADGEALRAGIMQQPYMIKPNSDELAVITGKKPEALEEIGETCKKIMDTYGIAVVAVSMGGDGALLFIGDEAYRAKPMKVKVLSTVGAGDSMVAGIAANLEKGPRQALQAGVAAATASITLEGTKLATKEIYDKMIKQVEIEKL